MASRKATLYWNDQWKAYINKEKSNNKAYAHVQVPPEGSGLLSGNVCVLYMYIHHSLTSGETKSSATLMQLVKFCTCRATQGNAFVIITTKSRRREWKWNCVIFDWGRSLPDEVHQLEWRWHHRCTGLWPTPWLFPLAKVSSSGNHPGRLTVMHTWNREEKQANSSTTFEHVLLYLQTSYKKDCQEIC